MAEEAGIAHHKASQCPNWKFMHNTRKFDMNLVNYTMCYCIFIWYAEIEYHQCSLPVSAGKGYQCEKNLCVAPWSGIEV